MMPGRYLQLTDVGQRRHIDEIAMPRMNRYRVKGSFRLCPALGMRGQALNLLG